MNFPLLGQYVSVDLVNSHWMQRGRSRDALADAAGAQRWLEAVSLNPLADDGTVAEAAGNRLRVDEQLHRALLGLRADVRGLLTTCARGEAPDVEVLTRLNDLAAAAPRSLHATPDATGALTLQRLRSGSPTDGLLAALAEDALALAADPAVAPALFECASHGCIGVLLRDDPRRVYCSPRCATRDRVARHAARTKEEH